MENDIYQNLNTPQDNPLITFKKSLFSRIWFYFLIVLLIFGVVLIILSFIFKTGLLTTTTPKITPTPQNTITPTTTANTNIPTQFLEKFTLIEKNINISEDFLPPQIDSAIGL